MRIHVDSLSHDGKGIARVDGKVAFVAGALPGEIVEVQPLVRRRRFDEYRLVAVVDTSADRVVPPCPLVGTCGGCDLQHLALEAQLRHKTDAVLQILERQAGLVPQELADPLRSAPFGYRRRARLAAYVPRRGQPVVGFREAGGKRIVPVACCPVLAPPLGDLPGLLEQALGKLERPAVLGHLELSLSESSDGGLNPVILVRTTAPLPDRDLAVLGELAASRAAYLSLQAGEAAARYLHRPASELPGYHLPEFTLRLGFEPGDFLQGNADVNRRLVTQVVDWISVRREGRVLDAFCGVGNFSLALARRGFEVVGLEAVPGMVERARTNASANGLPDVEFRSADLQQPDQTLSGGAFSAAVIDPPRTGAIELVMALGARRPPLIAYVSCWPPTLARDAAVLTAAGYRLERLGLVDMFPQTSHVEAVALFMR